MAKSTASRKQTRTYYFSVEGETEYWYLRWLEEQINNSEAKKFNVKIVPEVQQDPVSFAKKLVIQQKTTVWHLSDIEGSSPEQIQSVNVTIGRLKEAKNLGKSIDYKYGYSNLSFDLWMILHKLNCNAELTDVGKYLNFINKAFGEQFHSMREYKEEARYKRCLSKLSLEEVVSAVNRSKSIMQRNEQDAYPLTKFKGYSYYVHNPSLEIWQPIEKILADCGLM